MFKPTKPQFLKPATSKPLSNSSPQEAPEPESDKATKVNLLSRKPPSISIATLPYNARAAYVAHLRAVMALEQLRYLQTFLLEQSDADAGERKLIQTAYASTQAFVDSSGRKLHM